MLCEYSHLKDLKVWLQSVLLLLKYRSFSSGLLFIGAPCSSSQQPPDDTLEQCGLLAEEWSTWRWFGGVQGSESPADESDGSREPGDRVRAEPAALARVRGSTWLVGAPERTRSDRAAHSTLRTAARLMAAHCRHIQCSAVFVDL